MDKVIDINVILSEFAQNFVDYLRKVWEFIQNFTGDNSPIKISEKAE